MQSKPYELRRLRILAQQALGPRVLDVGYAALPNPYLSRFETTGYDMERPEKRPPGYREVVQGRAEEIADKLHERGFDSILCAELIEHLEEPYDFLRQLRTLLAGPQSRLILSTPNPLGIPVVAAELFGITRFFYAGDHTYYFLPRWIRRMLERTGYRLLRTVPVGLWLPGAVLPIVPAALSYQNVYVATKAD